VEETVADYLLDIVGTPAVVLEAEELFPRLYVCPYCAVVWATLEDTQSGDPLAVIGASCTVCNEDDYWYPVPGSILSVKGLPGGWDALLLRLLPAVLVEREFELHLRSIKGIQEDDC
jgi:hypothetical protein